MQVRDNEPQPDSNLNIIKMIFKLIKLREKLENKMGMW